MPRYRLLIEYDGSAFAGWQRQRGDRTVQQAIEEAVTRFSGEDRRIQGAGRTDAGVHASGQVAHLDLEKAWRTDTVRDALNAHLRPEPVSILSAEAVPESFNARGSAVRRHYLYRILNRRSPPALERSVVWHVPWALDADAMHEAAQGLLGQHDFTTFRAAECQASSPVRTLDRLDVSRTGAEIQVRTHARSFLHHQVRSLVGTLMLVGCGRMTAGGLREALDARDRARCGPMAPASGLCLTGVDYPEIEDTAA